MLSRSEASGLAQRAKTLDPQVKQLIAQIAQNRSVAVARVAPYAITAGNTPQVVMSYTFEPYELVVGSQIRASLWTTCINNSAGSVQLLVAMQATNQATGVFQLGFGTSPVPPAGGGINAYVLGRFDFMFAAGVPGAALPGQNYIPQIGAQPVGGGSTYASGIQQLNGFSLYGGGTGLVTNNAGSGAVTVGGNFQTGAGSNLSGGFAMRRQLTMENAYPTRIDLTISVPDFSLEPCNILAGVLEVL